MVTILQVDFPLEGPFGNEMAQQFEDLATSINHEPGFLWKIWTENESEQEAGGIYAFDNKTNAKKYLDMHSQRIKSMGVPYVNAKIFDVNEDLTQITKGRLD
ncbi:monooxygenase [Staphylococcus xylosus]|uniref:monooxygenase n=1 Tax=Staphylococcus xylosus TaxID=1288 RepID=UPI000D1D1750|nr:monooxygenase [Staphylococcus xylosus]MCE7781826.1 monooxygenase [Staphylococcus xylosus]MEB6320560.1 monooxygenase [Staphylococcus xylosus]PTI63062.1 monooxygenase [Staphylococcus xylosus]